MKHQNILIADDTAQIRQLLLAILAPLDCQVETAADGHETLAKLSPETDLLLLDLEMPDIDGLGVMRRLRADPMFGDLPVIMVTGRETREDRLLAVEAGVSDFIAKPMDRAEVLVRVKAQLRVKRAQDEVKQSRLALESEIASRTADLRLALADMQLAQRKTKEAHVDTIRRLVLAAELKDHDTSEHIVRISRFWAVLGRAIALADSEVEDGSLAATMHDVGKIGIPDGILRKRGPLTERERRVMQTHAEIGARILASSPSELMQAGEIIAISHHEKWDGSGYPRHLAGDAIPLSGRICAIVDVFDALTSRRSYRRAVSDAEAVNIMHQGEGRHFDPYLLGVFVDHLDEIVWARQESPGCVQQVPVAPPIPLPMGREEMRGDQDPACR